MASRPTNNPSRNGHRATGHTASSASYIHTGVRRNLFNGQHLRRPTTSSTNSTSATTLQAPSLNGDQDDVLGNNSTSSADIVVRDKNGNYEVEVPLMPVEKLEEILEKERDEARLADAIKHHTRDRNRTPSEPPELLAAVRASLRAKVASLQEDDWMFEGEQEVY